MQRKIIVVKDYADLGSSYYRPFADFGPMADPQLLFQDPSQVLCVVFTGGEDVDPSVYGEQANPKTFSNPRRDREEQRYFHAARKAGIPMAGICRGAQFLCAMSGGKLIQHVFNHGGRHNVYTTSHGIVEVTSTHHQMQLPPSNAKLLAWALPQRSDTYEGALGQYLHPEHEAEGVYYPNTNALGMQWHPEVMRSFEPGWKYTIDLIQTLLSGGFKVH